MRIAITNIGKMQIEVIQPVLGATGICFEGIDYERAAQTLHHIGIVVPGEIANWTAMEREIRGGGEHFALSFATDEASLPPARFAYVDTCCSSLGHHTEYLWWAPIWVAKNPALPDLGE